MIVVILVLAVLAMASAGVIVYVLESNRIENGVTAQIDQEILELRAFQRDAVDPQTFEPITDPNRLLEVFLGRNVPDDDELLVWYSGSRLQESSRPGQEDAQDLRTRNRYGEEILRLPAFREAVDSMIDSGGTAVLEDTPFGEVWVTAVPVQREGTGAVEGTLVIVNFLLDEHEELDSTMRTYAIVSMLSVGVLLLIAYHQSGRLLSPLRTLREAAEEITETGLDRRIQESGNDDITALTRTFNGMLDRLESAFAEQRQFLDDAGHELKTPVTVLRGHLELVDPDDPADVAATRDLLLEEVDRMGRLVGDLILLAKTRRPDFLDARPTDLARLTHGLLAKSRGLAERDWRLDGTAEVVLSVDEQRLTQAVLQLADNAVKHTGPGDTIAIGSSYDGRAVRIWVRDTGEGVPEGDREHVFERFGRSVVRPDDEGFGLGLSIVRAIASAHGGTVHVEDAPRDGPSGAVFVITLPH